MNVTTSLGCVVFSPIFLSLYKNLAKEAHERAVAAVAMGPPRGIR
jgi:hypothetical protein